MSMSTYVIGFVPPDETFKKMKSVYDACMAADVDPPSEVWEFFNHETPNDAGVSVDIDKFVTYVSPHDGADGFEIDLEVLANDMPQIKKIQFINNY